MSHVLKLALVQTNVGEDPAANVDAAESHVRRAKSSGSDVVCLPELFQSRYFPQRVDVGSYRLAERLPSRTTRRMGALAKELGIVLIVPVYEEAQPGTYFNTVVVFDADGAELGKYRKTHIPDGPQYHEKFYFTPGNLGYPVWETAFGSIGVGICYDQWFPEVARLFTLAGASVILYPTAIGSEPDRPGFQSAEAWRTGMRAHGIANGVFVGAVNRAGTEDEMTFYGESFVSDPFGEIVARAGSAEELLTAELDLSHCREMRELFQLLRDRRIDSYSPLLERVLE